MKNPLRYSFCSSTTYEHARHFVVVASVWFEGSSPFVRKLYTGVIQDEASHMAWTSTSVEDLSILGCARDSCMTDLFPPFFLVLASLDNMSSLVFFSRGTCEISARTNFVMYFFY